MKPILQFPGAKGSIMIQTTDVNKEATVVGTSRLDDTVTAVTESLSEKMEVLNTVSEAVSGVLEKSKQAFSNVEIEFGLSFTGKGNIYVVQAEAEATIKVKLTFDLKSQKDEPVR